MKIRNVSFNIYLKHILATVKSFTLIPVVAVVLDYFCVQFINYSLAFLFFDTCIYHGLDIPFEVTAEVLDIVLVNIAYLGINAWDKIEYARLNSTHETYGY